MIHVLTPPATMPDGVMGPTFSPDVATRDLHPRLYPVGGDAEDAERLITAQTRHQVAETETRGSAGAVCSDSQVIMCEGATAPPASALAPG